MRFPRAGVFGEAVFAFWGLKTRYRTETRFALIFFDEPPADVCQRM